MDRYDDTTRGERFCKLCEGGVVDDESHFIFGWLAFNETRVQSLESIAVPHHHAGVDEFQLPKLLLLPENIIDMASALKNCSI